MIQHAITLALSMTLKVVIFVLAGLLFLYIVMQIVGAILLSIQNKRVEQRNLNVNVLLAQKYDILVLLAKVFKKHKLNIPSEFEEELSPKMNESLKRLTLTERLTVKAYLMKASQTLLYFAELDENVKNDSEYKILKKSLLEIDKNHRKALTLYNADALGFNQKIHNPMIKLACIIFKFDEKEIVE